jgi:hypothetical protein
MYLYPVNAAQLMKDKVLKHSIEYALLFPYEEIVSTREVRSISFKINIKPTKFGTVAVSLVC